MIEIELTGFMENICQWNTKKRLYSIIKTSEVRGQEVNIKLHWYEKSGYFEQYIMKNKMMTML